MWCTLWGKCKTLHNLHFPLTSLLFIHSRSAVEELHKASKKCYRRRKNIKIPFFTSPPKTSSEEEKRVAKWNPQVCIFFSHPALLTSNIRQLSSNDPLVSFNPFHWFRHSIPPMSLLRYFLKDTNTTLLYSDIGREVDGRGRVKRPVSDMLKRWIPVKAGAPNLPLYVVKIGLLHVWTPHGLYCRPTRKSSS